MQLQQLNRIKFYLIQNGLPWALVVACFIWRYYFLHSRDICLDEPFTIYHAQKSLAEIIQLFLNGEPTPPLFMVLTHFGIKAFGTSDLLRILPLAFSSLTLLFLYKATIRLGNMYGALVACSLFMFSTQHFYFGLEIRTYSLLSLLTAIAYYLLVLVVHSPGKKWIVAALVITNICIACSHYFGWFVVFNQFILLLFYMNNRRVVKSLVKVISFTLLFSLPLLFLLVVQFIQSSKGTWIAPPGEGIWLPTLHAMLNSRFHFQVLNGVLLAGLAAFIYQMYLHLAFDRAILRNLLILFAWFAFPFCIMYLSSQRVPMFVDRYLLFNTIALFIFTGVAAGSLFKWWPFGLAAMLVIAFSSWYSMSINDRGFYYREVKNSVAHVSRYSQYDPVILVHPVWLNLEFTYYYLPNTFSNTTNLQHELTACRIFPVSSIGRVPDTLAKYKPQYVVIYGSETGELSQMVRSSASQGGTFSLVDSAFYPQTTHVLVFKRYSL